MPQPQTASCAVDGCTSPIQRRSTFCHAHVKNGGKSLVQTKAQRAEMRSLCCHAGCRQGDRHDYGTEYCKECKQACLWKANG